MMLTYHQKLGAGLQWARSTVTEQSQLGIPHHVRSIATGEIELARRSWITNTLTTLSSGHTTDKKLPG